MRLAFLLTCLAAWGCDHKPAPPPDGEVNLVARTRGELDCGEHVYDAISGTVREICARRRTSRLPVGGGAPAAPNSAVSAQNELGEEPPATRMGSDPAGSEPHPAG